MSTVFQWCSLDFNWIFSKIISDGLIPLSYRPIGATLNSGDKVQLGRDGKLEHERKSHSCKAGELTMKRYVTCEISDRNERRVNAKQSNGGRFFNLVENGSRQEFTHQGC